MTQGHDPRTRGVPATADRPADHHGQRIGHDDRGIGDLIKELRDETAALMRQEAALARTEMSEKAGRALRNVVRLAAGGLLAALGVVFLLAAINRLLTVGLAEIGLGAEVALWLAPLILGAVVIFVGWSLIKKATTTLRNMSLYPDQTVDSIKENAQWAKHKIA